ncbi:hypothetical protein Pcinc_004671 [Petrolisthes cinctipes]|uniref:Uncharacterized protein n=1 Tax=Petrolisthes cinctipes TaxID=88211 RepID=A0AAE1GGF3_PETCI|nr:hypothetical protein Pcinc_004671 [Petrolisthes cinctipes]
MGGKEREVLVVIRHGDRWGGGWVVVARPETRTSPMREPRLLALLRVVTLTSLCSAEPPCFTPTLSTPCISSKIVKGLTFVV